MTATDPIARLSDTARVALHAGGGEDRALSVNEIRAVVVASAPVVALTSGHTFTEAELEAATRDLEALFIVSQGPSIALRSEQRPQEWYFGERRRPGPFMTRYLKKLGEGGWAPNPLKEVENSTADVMELMDDPDREGAWDWRGLVVGNVQSGKTAHYAGLMNRAADAGYRVIIVLAGMHNVLRRQTQLRLDQDFLGFDTAGSTSGGGRRRVGVGLLPGPVLLVDSLTTSELSGDFSRTVAQNSNFAPADRPFVFVVKKNGSVLKNLNRWITRLPEESRQVPLLVIDDEADQASPDTGDQGVRPDGTFEEDYDPKRINGEIRKLLAAFRRSVYVGYTATPFANILIHDERSAKDFGDDLFPATFIVSLSAPDDYFGPLAVFGRDDDDAFEGLPLVRHIDQTDESWIPDPHGTTLRPVYRGLSRVPPSLATAMRSFVVASAARAARGQANVHKTMLVHVSRFQEVHDLVHAQVEEELREIRNAIAANDVEELGVLEEMWVGDFEPTTDAMRGTIFGRTVRPVTWAEITKHLLIEVDRIQVAVANGRSRNGIDYEAAELNGMGLSVIVIGGDKLSRGLTLEGLSTSYFLRVSRQYDSLLQMGRWFGYRKGYADLCRLFTTFDMEVWFRHLATVNEDLRSQLTHMRLTLATPKQYGLSIATHSVMNVTAANKRRYGAERPTSYAGEGKIQTVLFRDVGKVASNAAVVDAMLEDLNAPEEDPKRPSGGQARGLVWREVAGSEIATLLDGLAFPPESSDVDGRRMAAYIRRQIAVSELTRWTVYVPSGRGSIISVAGCPLKSVERKELERSTPARFIVKSILSPLDEAIDLDDDQFGRALTETNRVLAEEEMPETDRPAGPWLRAARGEDPRYGLLILYPIAPENLDLPNGSPPAYGVVVSFPTSKTAFSEQRLENAVRRREGP